MSELVARWIARGNQAHPAIRDAAGAHPYASVVERSRRIAGALLAGRASLEGERVALLVAPGADFVSSFFGVLVAGGCVVVLSPLHPAPETRYFCDDAEVKTVIVSPEHEALAAPLGHLAVRKVAELREGPLAAPAHVDAKAAALQLYTSGTTGKPKGAILTHANIAIQQRLVGEAWGFSPRDVLLHALPLHHMHGLAIALLTALGAGATTHLTHFDAPKVWDAMKDATVFMGVPAMYHRLFLAFDAADTASRARWAANARALRLATSGSAALPVTLAERWRSVHGNIPLERFGMTEIGVGISNRLEGERFPGCVGFPLPTVETRIEDGELWIRGPSVFPGYWKKEEETKKAFTDDGWFRTGDTVSVEANGAFKILGRTSVDILKSGGYKLSALEIEEAIREHEAVAEVAVVGVPDEAWGDRVVGCVVLRPGKACGAEELRAFVKTRLAAYKTPKDVVFLADLPKNALGKVVKPTLLRLLNETSK